LKILLIALAWPLFGLSVAEKAVTLIRTPSHSGESEALSQSQVWVAGLGNLTFAIALFMGQWSLAMAAIAMNWVFAGALWQGFRQRLMYLFDPDSQPAVRPPTILSSVIASVGMMELGVVLSIPLLMFAGKELLSFAHTMGYGVAAALVCLAVWRWHRKHDVDLGDIIFLDGARPSTSLACLGGAAAGTLLGVLGIGYMMLLQLLPWPEVSVPLEQGMRFFTEYPGMRQAFAIMSIGIAPWVEEFIFRGLMFRAMLPQWGMGRAVIASSAFFAVLHSPLVWPMVFCLGALNALVFVRTRSLLPCIVLHASYNAVIVGLS
jgi:membrane protease YdiL (CAAX protease family)